MGFTGSTVSSSLAILATLLLLSTTAAAHLTLVNPLCEGATDKALCTHMLKGANKWPAAMSNMIAAATRRVKAAGKPIAYGGGVGAKLPATLPAKTKQSIDLTCKQAFDTLISYLKKSAKLVENDPTCALQYKISMLTFFDCRNALEEFGVSVAEVNKFDVEVRAMTNSLLAVLLKNPQYASTPAGFI